MKFRHIVAECHHFAVSKRGGRRRIVYSLLISREQKIRSKDTIVNNVGIVGYETSFISIFTLIHFGTFSYVFKGAKSCSYQNVLRLWVLCFCLSRGDFVKRLLKKAENFRPLLKFTSKVRKVVQNGDTITKIQIRVQFSTAFDNCIFIICERNKRIVVVEESHTLVSLASFAKESINKDRVLCHIQQTFFFLLVLCFSMRISFSFSKHRPSWRSRRHLSEICRWARNTVPRTFGSSRTQGLSKECASTSLDEKGLCQRL